MTLARRAVELPPGWRWHTSRLRNALHRRAFGSYGEGTVVVRPHILRGVDRIHLGARVAVYDGAWLACEDGEGPIRVGDDTYLGHRVHLHAGAALSIGSGCVLADDVFVSTTDHDPGHLSTSSASAPVTIGERVFLGQRAIVLGGVTIGDGARVGAGAVVTHDVPAGATVAGVPARVVR
jgi:acetyltransferase-like isoleucine patch superfamily enzyme